MPTYDAAAVLLDMDGTLVDSTPVVERTWTRWAHDHGIDPAKVLAVCHGRQGHLTMAELLPDRPQEENLAENRALLEYETTELDGVTPVVGAADFVASLADVPHALVTSADVPVSTVRMAHCDIAYPTIAITAEDVTRSKPDPEGFLEAAARLSVTPEQCLVFEDSAAGIAAARAAGMRVIGVGPIPAAKSADWHIDDYSGVVVQPTDDGVRITFP